MNQFDCPYLGGQVELSDERTRHIAERHPELADRLADYLSEVIRQPEAIRRSARSADAMLLSRYFPTLLSGKHIVAVIVTDPTTERHWIVTAYLTGRLTPGSNNE